MTDQKTLAPILYVDDEIDNLTVFNSAFRRHFKIHLASSAIEGLEIMKKNEIQLVISDQRMPEMTGTEFLEMIIPDYPDCIRVILTGFSDINAVIQAINNGRVYRYVTKPWDKEEMKIMIDNALETYYLKQQNKKLIEDLLEANKTLEQKVIDRTLKIELQNKEIRTSIKYAGRIQNALMPPKEYLDNLLPSYFIFNRPCEIVSGDFFWLGSMGDEVLIAVADGTGHGVPGAFMSILGIASLNEIINKSTDFSANEILNQLRKQVIKALHQTGDRNESKDGMDIAICIIDFNKGKLQFSGASRPLYLIRDNELMEFQGDKMPIGIYFEEELPFTNIEIRIKKNDLLYLFTDGFIDQSGGLNKKTFKSQNFKKLLLDYHTLPLVEQRIMLEKAFEEWKDNNEQIDDILVFGIKI
ncbi:MAG: SpoIIE family protein phosphatase [Bacteroidales bacterium]